MYTIDSYIYLLKTKKRIHTIWLFNKSWKKQYLKYSSNANYEYIDLQIDNMQINIVLAFKYLCVRVKGNNTL